MKTTRNDLRPLSDEEILVVLIEMKKEFKEELKAHPYICFFLCIEFSRIYGNMNNLFNMGCTEDTAILFPKMASYKPPEAGCSWFNLTQEGHKKRMALLNKIISDYTKKVKTGKDEKV